MAVQYDAFISYSHAADEPTARAVQRALEQLAKPFYRWKARNVFRDATSLSANPALWSSIEQALAKSSFFILFACPESAASRWCVRELEWWLTNRKPETLLLVLTGGDFAFDEQRHDIDWRTTTALPKELSGRFAAEPLFCDLRWAKRADELALRNTRFRSAVLPLAAALHGKEPQELDSDDLREFRRARLFWRGATVGLIALTVTSVIAAWLAVRQRDEAIRQRNFAVARQLAVKAQFLQVTRPGLLPDSVMLAVESLRRVNSFEADQVIRSGLALLPLAKADRRFQGYMHDPGMSAVAGWRLAFSTEGAEFHVVAIGRESSDIDRWQADRRIRTIAFSPTGSRLAFGADDGTVLLWDVGNAPPIEVGRCKRAVLALAMSETSIAAACDSGPTQIIAADTHVATALGDALEDGVGLAFNRDGSRLAIARADGSLVVWDTTKSSEVFRTPASYPGAVYAWTIVAFDRAGGIVVRAADWERSLVLRNASNGDAIARLNHRDAVRSLEFDEDGDRVTTASADGTARVFDTHNGGLIAEVLHAGPVRSSRFARSGFSDRSNMILTASEDGTARLWLVNGGRELARATHGTAIGLAVPGGADVFTTLAYDGAMQRWERAEGGELFGQGGLVPPLAARWSSRRAVFVLAYPHGHLNNLDPRRDRPNKFLGEENWDRNADSAQFSSDGQRVLIANRERAEVWDTETGTILWQERHENVRARALSPAGDRVAVLAPDAVRVYDVATGRELREVPAADARQYEGMATSGDFVAFSHSASKRLVLCDTSSAAPTSCADLGPDRVDAFAIDGSHKYLVWGGWKPGALALAGRNQIALAGSDGFFRAKFLGFSSASSRVYAASDEHVRVWSLPDGKLLLDVPADSEVTALACSSDCDIVAAGTKDGAVVVWTLADQQRATSIAASSPTRGFPAPITAVALSDHGEYLMTTTGGATRIWALSADRLAAQACARIAQDLTEQDWAAYAGGERRVAPCARASDASGATE